MSNRLGGVFLKILFWDIDGTLIRTGKAGLFAFEQATRELWSKLIDFDKIRTAGMTDFSIAAEIIEMIAGRPATLAEAQRLATRYEELLPQHLAERQGQVLPYVAEILEAVHKRDDAISLLLTGNSRVGAEHKLRKYGLAHYFDFNASAFCDCHLTRDEVASVALAAAQKFNPPDRLSVFVIGDTPNDIRCGKLIDASTIGVATGAYELEQLRACEPWWAIDRLPEPGHFLAKLGL